MADSVRKIVQHTFFHLLLPTMDIYGDINFSISAFSTKHYGIGLLMVAPVVLNVLFIMYKWKTTRFDSSNEKRFTWLLVVIGFWPQYQFIKLIISIVRSKNWKEKEDKINDELSYIEPFIESIPQCIASVCVYMTLLKAETFHGGLSFTSRFTATWSRNDTEILVVFGEKTLGVSNAIMYPLSLSISLFSGVKCVSKYLHRSPMKIVSEKTWKNVILFISKLIYIITSFFCKSFVGIIVSINNASDHGYRTLLMIFIYFILIPSIFFIAPVVRYLGLKRASKLFLKNPQLIILPFITDYVFGPFGGYGTCIRDGSCCYWRCCCWLFCCKVCKFETRHQITISRNMSLAKMLYSLVGELPNCAMIVDYIIPNIRDTEKLGDIMILVSYLVLLPIGAVCFAISLHIEKNYGVLNLNNSEQDNEMASKKNGIEAESTNVCIVNYSSHV